MKIENNKVALINYTLTDTKGEKIDDSNGKPIAFLQGHNNLILGLENALKNKEVGDKFTTTILADDAYGETKEHLIQKNVPKEMFKGADKISIGMRFEAQSEQGLHSVVITEMTGEHVTVDGNHELAGLDLTFKVEVMGIRDATKEELEHGHAHGEGGYQH